MVIEFFGLPGAGKTTLVSRLNLDGFVCGSPSVMSNGKPRKTKFDKLLFACSLVCQHRELFGQLLRTKASAGRGVVSLSRIYGLMVTYDRILCARARDARVVLDQGLVQDLWSLSAFGIPLSDASFSVLVDVFVDELPDVLIYLKSDPNTASLRVAARTGGKGRFDLLPASEREHVLARQVNAMGGLTRAISKIERVRVLELDARESVENNIALLAARLPKS